MAVPIRRAAALGGRAVARSGWLVAVGLVVAVARRALLVPAAVVAWALVLRGAALGASRAPTPAAALEGAAAVATSPGFLLLVGGLWAAGAVLGAVLRVAWTTGALATLGRDLSGDHAAPPRFGAAIAWDLPRVLATALLAGVAELAGGGFALALAAAAVRVSAAAVGRGASPLLAAAVAAVLTVAVAVPVVLSIAADAAVARAALRGEGPTAAVAAAGARILARPAAFVAAALGFLAAGAVAAASVQAAGAGATSLAHALPPLVALAPQAMVGAAVATVAAAVELWWLGTVAVLACHEP